MSPPTSSEQKGHAVRVELPSGAWIDLRDKLLAEDLWEIQGSIKVSVSADGEQTITSGVQNAFRKALLKQVITNWSFEGTPIPANNPGGAEVMGKLLDAKDWNHLCEVTQPMLDEASYRPNQPPSSS
jgi:hypothetical protein